MDKWIQILVHNGPTYFSLAWASEGAPDPLPLAYMALDGGPEVGGPAEDCGGPTNVMEEAASRSSVDCLRYTSLYSAALTQTQRRAPCLTTNQKFGCYPLTLPPIHCKCSRAFKVTSKCTNRMQSLMRRYTMLGISFHPASCLVFFFSLCYCDCCNILVLYLVFVRQESSRLLLSTLVTLTPL